MIFFFLILIHQRRPESVKSAMLFKQSPERELSLNNLSEVYFIQLSIELDQRKK